MFQVLYEDTDGCVLCVDEPFASEKDARIYASFLIDRFCETVIRAWVEEIP